MSDIEKALRYALQSLPSPKMKTTPIFRQDFAPPKPTAPQVWIDELEAHADKLAIGFDLGSIPATTFAARYSWKPDGMKVTPISEAEFYGIEGEKDPSNKSSNNKA